MQDEAEIRLSFPEIMEGAVKRQAVAARLPISMNERHLHSQGGIEKGKLRLSQMPIECGQVMTGVAPREKRAKKGRK